MSLARTIHSNNIVAGAGEIRIARYLSDGSLDGERYVGDSVGLSMSVSTELRDVQSGDGATPRDIETITTSTDRTFSFVLHDISPENLALFFQGETGAQDNTNAAVTDEKLSVRPGRWYALGQTAANPAGWGALKDLASTTITTDPSGTTYALTTDVDFVADAQVGTKDRATMDILVDLKRGAIYVSPYGDLKAAGPHKLLVDYTPAEPEVKRPTIKSGSKSVLVAMRYIEQSQDGAKGQDIYVRRMRLSANGEYPFKSRDSEQTLPMQGKVLIPTDGFPAVFGIQSMGPDNY